MRHILLVILLFAILPASAQITVGGKSYTVDECVKNADMQEQQGHYREASEFLNGAAFHVWEQKDYDKAIELFNHSTTLNEKINNIGGIAGIASNLGMIYNDKKDYNKALESFQKALEIRTKQKEKPPIIKTHINMSVVLNNLKRFDESINHLNDALRLSGEINDTDEIKTCYAMLAETYEKKGDSQTARQYFDKYMAFYNGVQRDRETQVKSSIEKIQKNLELTESEKKDKEVQLALKEKQLYDRQKLLHFADSANRALSQQIVNADLKLQALEKEEQINELQRQKIENKLKQEQQIRLFILIIVIVLSAFLLILYNTLRRIKRLNKLLTERNEEVLRQKQSLEDENKIRTKLLSILSHDLRTPLSAVYLFLQIMRSKTLSEEMVQKHMARLETSLASAFQMLDNMLYWAKNQISGIKYKPEVLNVCDMVESNIRLLNTGIQNKSIDIIDNIEEDVVYIFADKEMVNIVLRNIVANAIKFTPEAGKIKLSCSEDKQYAIIIIQDTGLGMSEEQQKNIFSTSVTSQTGTANETGTGLGLVLVHDFVEMCKGKITFTSKVGEGTTFYISFPLATVDQLNQKIDA